MVKWWGGDREDPICPRLIMQKKKMSNSKINEILKTFGINLTYWSLQKKFKFPHQLLWERNPGSF